MPEESHIDSILDLLHELLVVITSESIREKT